MAFKREIAEGRKYIRLKRWCDIWYKFYDYDALHKAQWGFNSWKKHRKHQYRNK